MARIKQAVIGDLHLGVLWKLMPNHLALQIALLHFIMRRIVDEGIKSVVLTGDNFDAPVVELEIVREFLTFINTYPEIEFIWLCGNHDRTSLDGESHIDLLDYMTKTGSTPNLKIILEPTKIGVVSYVPHPYTKGRPNTKLAYGHTDRPGARRDNGTAIHCDMEWDESIEWVIGHNHTYQVIKKTRYIGTPYQISFGEQPEKYWGIVEYETDPKKKLKLKFRAIPIVLPYKLLNVKIDKASDLKKLEPAPTYYKLTVEPGVKLPNDFLVTHANCQLRNKVMQRIEIQAKQEEDVAEGENPHDLMYKLPEYLEGRGLTEKQIRKGAKLAKDVIDKLREPA